MTIRKPKLAEAIAMLAVAIMVACGGNMTKIIPPASSAFRHLTSRAASGSHPYRPQSGVAALSLFATAPAPSALQQSFQGKCSFTISLSTVPAGSILPLVIDRGDDNNCNTFFSAPNPSLGTLVIEDGTVGTLVAVADSDDGATNLICKDLANQQPVTDGQFVSAWFRPSDNAVILFSNTTQLTATCSLPVKAGANVTRISAQFLKN